MLRIKYDASVNNRNETSTKMPSKNSFSLEELLRHCTDPRSSQHQSAWQSFLERYSTHIYNQTYRYCSRFHLPGLNAQFKETVDDIVLSIHEQLVTKKYKALKSFQLRENELAFLAFLSTMCRFTTIRYLQKYRRSQNVDPSDLDGVNFIVDSDIPAELWYNDIVRILRRSKSKGARNKERNIHIFLLYTFADLPPEVIRNGCLSKIGKRVIDVEVYRIREILRTYIDKFL